MLDKSGVITLRVWGNGRVERLEGYHSWLLSGVRAENIQSHGRLIDADALRDDWLENGENEYVYDTNAFLESIDSVPTIVDAEEEE